MACCTVECYYAIKEQNYIYTYTYIYLYGRYEYHVSDKKTTLGNEGAILA